MKTYDVEVHWIGSQVYTVEAIDENEAIELAMDLCDNERSPDEEITEVFPVAMDDDE